MKGKRQIEIMKCVLLIGIFGILLFSMGCSMIPKSSVPLVDMNNAGVSGNESHITNSTGSVINSTLSGVTIGTFTVTMQTKAINVEREAVKFNLTVPVSVTAPIKIMENVSTNVLFWQVMTILATIASTCFGVIWLILKFKR